MDPYRQAGLRCNPFVLDAGPGVAPELFVNTGTGANLSPPEPHQRRFVQLIGDKGAGKTTHLLHWRRIHPGAYVHLPDGAGRFRWLPVTPICYWDELNKSPWPVLQAAVRLANARGATVVAGTHEDRSRLPRRLGMTLDTLEFAALTGVGVQRWARTRIQAVALGGDTLPAPTLDLALDQAEAIAARAGTSWRTAADELHVWAARRVAERMDLAQPVQVRSAPVAAWNHPARVRGRQRRQVASFPAP